MSIETLACKQTAATGTAREQILVGLDTCWRAWLAGRFPAQKPEDFAGRLAFHERSDDVLGTEKIPHDFVAAYARSVGQPEISLALPVDRPCYAEKLPPEFMCCWQGFEAVIRHADRNYRVVWGIDPEKFLQANHHARYYSPRQGQWIS